MMEIELHPNKLRVLAEGGTSIPAAYDFYLQGRGYLQRYENPENINSAISLFEKSLKEDPDYALAYAGLGEAYWRKYEATKGVQWVEYARTNCNLAIKLNTQMATVHVTLGLLLTGTGRQAEAIEEFHEALNIDPVNADAYRWMARAYESLGKLQEAETIYKKAIELRPNYWAGFNYLGAYYVRNGRYPEAAKQFERVTELTPDNIRGFNNLGGVLIHLEKWQEAKVMFERSLSIQPNYAAYSSLAALHFFQEARYADAARMYEKALEIDSKDYRVWGSLGSAYYWAPGERSKAYAAYQRGTQIAEEQRKVNPNDATVLSHLANFYGMIGETNKALELLEKALTSTSADVNVCAKAGETYEQLGMREKALLWIGKALSNGYPSATLERDPGLRELRADSRFKRLVKTLSAKSNNQK
jgi:serine/threonine-protein kinase